MKASLKKTLLVLFFALASLSKLEAQKANGDALRFYGSGFMGGVFTDWERRRELRDALSLQFNKEWRGVGNLSFLNQLGVDFYYNLGGKQLTHLVFGYNSLGFNANYTWDPAPGFVVSRNKGESLAGINDLNVGTSFSVSDQFRIIPKFYLKTFSQSFQSEEAFLGLVAGLRRGEAESLSGGGVFGVQLEYDLRPNLTLLGEFYLLSPVLLQFRGNYDSFTTTFTGPLVLPINQGLFLDGVTGGHESRFRRIALGTSVGFSDSLRIFLLLESNTVLTRAVDTLAFSVSVIGASSNFSFVQPTILSRFLDGKEERFVATGLRFGINYEVNFR